MYYQVRISGKGNLGSRTTCCLEILDRWESEFQSTTRRLGGCPVLFGSIFFYRRPARADIHARARVKVEVVLCRLFKSFINKFACQSSTLYKFDFKSPFGDGMMTFILNKNPKTKGVCAWLGNRCAQSSCTRCDGVQCTQSIMKNN